MATFYVDSSGSNTAPYDTWAKAATTFLTAVDAVTANGDEILVHKTLQDTLSVNTTYIFDHDVRIYVVDKDAGDALAQMGTGGWIGNANAQRLTFTINNCRVYCYGLTPKSTGSNASSDLWFSVGNRGHLVFEKCFIDNGTDNTGNNILFNGTNEDTSFVELIDCDVNFGATGQTIQVNGGFEWRGGKISVGSAAITEIIEFSNNRARGSTARIEGVDLSNAATTATLVTEDGSTVSPFGEAYFTNCTVPSSYSLVSNTAHTNKTGVRAWVFDCASGDVHVNIAYGDAMGTVVSDTGIYFTSGAAAQSWKIVTTANASFTHPFVTPWIDYYNSTLTSISPYLEALRDNNASKYQNDEVWSEWMVKETSGVPLTTFDNSDRMTPRGTPADQTAGTDGWTGDTSASFMKLERGSVTPAEVGHIRARVAVGEPSITVYVDPQVRV